MFVLTLAFTLILTKKLMIKMMFIIDDNDDNDYDNDNNDNNNKAKNN